MLIHAYNLSTLEMTEAGLWYKFKATLSNEFWAGQLTLRHPPPKSKIEKNSNKKIHLCYLLSQVITY